MLVGMIPSRPAVPLATLQTTLNRHGFVAHVASSRAEVVPLVLERILPDTGARHFAAGGSMTFDVFKPELLSALAARGLVYSDNHEPGVSWPELVERRRASLLTDLFFTGVNAVTAHGQLVSLDATGNRIAAMLFGPKHVVVFAGRNKIVPDLAAAKERVRRVAPLNAKRLGFATPCVAAGRCVDCSSPARICNAWAVVERPFPAGRIHVVLIDDDLGL